jgi:hypothetical protein
MAKQATLNPWRKSAAKTATSRQTITFHCSQMNRYPETIIIISASRLQQTLRITHSPLAAHLDCL